MQLRTLSHLFSSQSFHYGLPTSARLNSGKLIHSLIATKDDLNFMELVNTRIPWCVIVALPLSVQIAK